MSKGSEKIRQRSYRKFAAAIERLKQDAGIHPRHIGERVKITVASVAREARMGRATLHRFPDLCEQIKAFGKNSSGIKPKRTSAEQRADAHKAEVAELQRQIQGLLEQNLLLTMRITKYEPQFNVSKIVPIGPRPRGKRAPTNVATGAEGV